VSSGIAEWADEAKTRVGFFTDTSVCIGCKACEVACKEWNLIPQDGQDFLARSYDNTGELNGETWRHVAFIEQEKPLHTNGDGTTGLRWLMESDVCKHCTHAACLDVCPTGALFRTEFGTVCYDRLRGGHEPACAKACPTKSIQFGPLDELRERADARLEKLQDEGWNGAQLYLRDPDDGIGGGGAFFLLLDDPEVYGLPPDPVVTTSHLGAMWTNMAAAAAVFAVGIAGTFLWGSHD